MKIKPLADRVVIEPEKHEGGKTKAGIYLPETAQKDQPETGTVIAVGPGKLDEDGKKRIPMSVKKGDRVLFSTYRQPTKMDDKEYFILGEDDILGLIE